MKHFKQMSKFASSTLTGIAVIGVTLLASVNYSHATEPLAITKGRANLYGGALIQNVAVQNNADKGFSIVIIDCDFYDRGTLVGTGKGSINNLMRGMTKGAAVYGMSIDKADTITCSLGTTLVSK